MSLKGSSCALKAQRLPGAAMGCSSCAACCCPPHSNSRSSGRTGLLSGMMLFFATSRGIALRMSVQERGGGREGTGVVDAWLLQVAGKCRHHLPLSPSHSSTKGADGAGAAAQRQRQARTKGVLLIAVVAQHSSVHSVAKLRGGSN